MQTPVSVVDTGTMIPTTVSPASVSLMEKEQKDYTLSLQGGKGNLTIFHGSGSTLSIHFLSES